MFKYVKFEKVPTEYTVLEFLPGDDKTNVNFFTGVDVVSIEADNEAEIDALIAKQPVEINCVEITQDEFKSLVDSTAQVLRIREVVKESYDRDLAVITHKYPLPERETWKIQKEEAEKFLESKNEDDSPFLKILAEAEGSTVEEFANAVMAKNDAFVTYSAQALAKKRTLERELFAKIGL